MKHYYKKISLLATLIAILGFCTTSLKSQVLINEGFTTMVPLPTGWAQQNLSTPAGTNPTWFQGNPAVFSSFSGATTAYAAVNFNSVAGANTINNWLFTPTVAIANGNIFTFYARAAVGGGQFPDRLQLRMSTNGASVNVGATNTSVGDFTTLLVDINPTQSSTGFPEAWTQYSVTISGVPTPTTGRFAFRYFVTDGGPSGNNSNFIGVDEVVYGVACSGAPTPGNTLSTVTTSCPTVPFTLSLQNPPAGVGTTYQWQSSATGVAGSFTNIAGATNPTLTTSLTAATYYQAVVRCGAASTTSTPVQVALSVCYCPASATSTAFEKISRVTLGSLNNASTSTAGYEDFTALSTDIFQGATMPITVTLSGGFAADQVLVWIDFNKDYDFTDPGELVYTSANGVGPHNGNIVIPATAALGATRMRVRMHDTSLGPNSTSCGTSTYGQVEDYTVNIVPCVPVSVTTQPAAATISCGGNATFSVVVAGSLPAYQWQFRVNATSQWQTVPNSAPYSGVNSSTLSITSAPVSFNGYQYRVITSGACSGADFSGFATLTVNPFTLAVTPASGAICTTGGTPVLLTVPNNTNVATFNNTTSTAVPDNSATGSSSNITVSGIPVGATITRVAVTFSMTHTWVGDMVINLKAPTATATTGILNLVGLLNGGTGSNNTANFVNTVVASDGVTVMSGAPAPRTGTFRADALLIAGGPTNGVSNVTTWASLLSGNPNGTWSLYMADAGAGDLGTLTSWSISITYGSAPATAVFTPVTGLYTNAAATTPYTGGPVSQVYAFPTASTTYSAVVSTATCTTAAQQIPITYRTPPTAVSAVANKSICPLGNTTFTANVTGGVAFAYQWKVSTDGGATYTNVTNAGVYSGATTGTLTITGAPLSYNGYKYALELSAAPCLASTNLTSAPGTLTVNPIPVIVVSANPFTSIYPGQTTTLSAAVSPNAGANYTWFRDGVVVPGATANTLVVDVDGLGVYKVTVADVNGCSSTSSTVEIKEAANDILFIYPSPNTGQFQVRYYSELGSTQFPRTVNVYDNKGTRVFTKAYSINSPYTRIDVDLKNQAKGLYSVELTDYNGNRIKTGRVLVL